MGKFGIGARVRDDGGDAGEIVDKRKGARLVRYDDTDYGSIWQQKGRLSALSPEVVANDNEVSPCAPVFEKEYSVGDRVRALVDWLGVKAGEEYTVKRLHLEDDGTVKGAWVLEENKGYLSIDEFEPATPAVPTPTFAKGDRALSQSGDYVTVDTDPDDVDHVWVSFGTTKWRTPVSWLTKWEPKVGDRVRVASESNIFRVGTPAGCEGTITHVYDGAGVYLDLEHPRDGVIGQTCHDYQRYLEPLPVAEQPAAEPAEPAPLVAEWVEPVAEPEPVAVAEATATPFKKGDRLLCVNADATNLVKVGGIYTATEDQAGDFVDMPHGMYASRFVLAPVEPAAPPAKFKVGDLVTLTAPARISGFDKKNAMVLLETGGSFVLPIASLIAA